MGNVAQQVAKSLYDMGVRRVFGIPGGPSIPYMDAMKTQGIEFILVSNEQSAAIMADITARYTGVPGVCHATFGAGATNLSTGVGEALLDRSSLIAFTTEMRDSDRPRTMQMNINHQMLFFSITKMSTRLKPDCFRQTMESAYSMAISEQPGSVHIGLPVDIATVELSEEDCVVRYETIKVMHADFRAMEVAIDMMRLAKKPIVVIGLTAVRLGLHHELRSLMEIVQVPVVLTPMAKGVIPVDHPWYAGVLFHACSDRVAAIYRQADTVLAIGYDPIEFNYESWMPNVRLIHIDTVPADITETYRDVCNVVGDMAYTITMLRSGSFPAYSWDRMALSRHREELFAALQPVTDTFSPSDTITVLQRMLDASTIVTVDVGAHLHLMGQLWRVDEPGRFLITNGWSAMGFAIPAAIGAALCNPETPVVCVTGDGGFLMNCGELMTVRRLGLKIVVVVLCDQSLSLIEVKQQWQQVSTYGVDLYEKTFIGANTFLGLPVLTATNTGEMASALEYALSADSSVIIEASVDGSQYSSMITRNYR